MNLEDNHSQFAARLLRPRNAPDDGPWAFIVLPREVSALLSRRGRVTVEATINGKTFRRLLEPDGRKSHWLQVDRHMLDSCGASAGDEVMVSIEPVDVEPEPDVPVDLKDALSASPDSQATWDSTTSIARLDWIHWITSAKQARTRAKRIQDACQMLASGKKRVCCFDPSGFYSKAFGAPETGD